MPVPSLSDSKWNTYYDVLDAVRRWPGLLLGGVDNDWTRGTRMPRLQAFLMALRIAGLDEGDPPFHDFAPWLSVRVDGISNSHNMPFHWLEERAGGADSAFDCFFALLDEYRACHATTLQRCTGPFEPTFLVGLENPQLPEQPDSIVLGRFEPSDVYFWGEVYGTREVRQFPFSGTLVGARRAACDKWGIDPRSWSDD